MAVQSEVKLMMGHAKTGVKRLRTPKKKQVLNSNQEKKRSLKLANKTRFNSKYIMLERLNEVQIML